MANIYTTNPLAATAALHRYIHVQYIVHLTCSQMYSIVYCTPKCGIMFARQRALAMDSASLPWCIACVLRFACRQHNYSNTQTHTLRETRFKTSCASDSVVPVCRVVGLSANSISCMPSCWRHRLRWCRHYEHNSECLTGGLWVVVVVLVVHQHIAQH